MPNFWTIATQKIAEAFSGPRTKDEEFDQKVDQMKTIEKSIVNLKTILLNYVSSTSGIKTFCREFSDSILCIYSKDSSSYGDLGNDISVAHNNIEAAYEDMVLMLNELNSSTSEWTMIFNTAKNLISKREEGRKIYDHYDEKMEKFYRTRHEKIKKNSIETSKETEVITRNELKYKKATETYISLSTNAYEEMCNALDYRYSKINPVISKFIECENRFYQTVYNSFRMIENIENKFITCNKKYVRPHISYDPTKYIRGGELIKPQNDNKIIKTEELDRTSPKSDNNIQGRIGTIDYKENDTKKSIYYNKPNSTKQTIVADQNFQGSGGIEDINNPYSQINFKNIQNVFYRESNSHSQPQPLENQRTFNFQNMNNNNTNIQNQSNNFDFSKSNNPTNNYTHSQRLSNSISLDKMNNISPNNLYDYPDFNTINQASTHIKNGANFYQNNKESLQQGYSFYQNNQNQINQRLDQGNNFYQSNQQTINSITKSGVNSKNQPNQSNNNKDIFFDFFK